MTILVTVMVEICDYQRYIILNNYKMMIYGIRLSCPNLLDSLLVYWIFETLDLVGPVNENEG